MTSMNFYCRTINQLDAFITSGSRGWAKYYSESGDLFLRITNIDRDHLDPNLANCKYVSLPEKGREGIRTHVQPKDILITITADLGAISFISDTFNTTTYINQHIALVRITRDDVNNKYVAYFLSSALGQRQFYSLNDAGSKSGLNLNAIRRTKIWLPTKLEQDAIVDILSKWDHAIVITEQLITAKRIMREALSQLIFSGQWRYSGYSKPWSTFNLGEIFTNRTESGKENLPLLSITGKGGVVSRETIIRRDTSNPNKSRYLRICPGDIGYNTMRMWQGVSGLSSMEGIVSPAYTIVTPDSSLDAEFMAVFFKYPPIINLFRRYSQGLVNDTLNLKFRHFSEIKVTIPEKDEQTKIASVFRIIDQELSLLKQELNLLKEQKKGLMQQLLTGKIRVKTTEAA